NRLRFHPRLASNWVRFGFIFQALLADFQEKLGSFCKNIFFRPFRGIRSIRSRLSYAICVFRARVSRAFLKSTDHSGGSRCPSATQEHGIRNGPRLSLGWRSRVGARVLILLPTFSPYRRKPVSTVQRFDGPRLTSGWS